MKTYTISAQTVVSAAKHQWKRFLAIILAFTVLGAGAGLLFADRGSSESGGGGADTLPKVDFNTVAYTKDYYSDCLQALVTAYNLLNTYLSTVSSVELPDGSVETLLERLTALNTETSEVQKNILAPLQTSLAENGAIYIPEEFMDDLANQYESQLSSIEFDLLVAEVATETIRQMGVPNYDNIFVISSYTSLIQQAENYGNLLKSQAVYEKTLAILRDEPERVRSESRQMEQELDKASADLNTLLDKASQVAEGIGKAADVFITLQPNGTSYKVVVNYTYRAVPLAESFAAIELFCVLVGICVGGFFAVCREAKVEKDTAEKPSEHQHTAGEE